MRTIFGWVFFWHMVFFLWITIDFSLKKYHKTKRPALKVREFATARVAPKKFATVEASSSAKPAIKTATLPPPKPVSKPAPKPVPKPVASKTAPPKVKEIATQAKPEPAIATPVHATAAAPKDTNAAKQKALLALKNALQEDSSSSISKGGHANSFSSELALLELDEDVYREEIRIELEKSLKLPMKEKTSLSLTLKRDGTLKRCDVKKSSLKNRRYLEEKLFSLQFRAFGPLFRGESEHTFIVELEYD